MKKITLFLISIILIGFMAVGCGKKSNGNEDKTSKLPNTEQNATNENVSNTPDNSVNNANTTSKKGKVIQLNTKQFKEKVFDFENNKEWVYNGTLPCVIDFYADWCGPCKRVAPIMEELAKDYAGKIIFYKVNVDNNQPVAQVFGIQSIPSVLFVPMNGKPQMAVGAMEKQAYVNAIQKVFGVK